MLTRTQFNQLAKAALTAVAYVEGWDAEHPSWILREKGRPQPSKKFRRELLTQLSEEGVTVDKWDYTNHRWRPQ